MLYSNTVSPSRKFDLIGRSHCRPTGQPSIHAYRELTDLLYVTAGTGIGHHEERVELIHGVLHQGISNIFRSFVPNINDLAVASPLNPRLKRRSTLSTSSAAARISPFSFGISDIRRGNGQTGQTRHNQEFLTVSRTRAVPKFP